MLITFSTATCFKISTKSSEEKHDIIHLFTKEKRGQYFAIDRRDEDWWFIDSVSKTQEIIAEKEIYPEFSLDSNGLLFYEKKQQAFIFDANLKKSRAVDGAPFDITSVCNHPSGGFWLSSRSGALYFVTPEGVCRKITILDHLILENPHVQCWNNLLLWTASCQKYTPGAGEESRFVQVFLKPTIKNGRASLEIIGERDYDLTEGSLNTFTFDDNSEHFFVFFTLFGKNRVKSGTLMEFILRKEMSRKINGIRDIPQAAALSPDGKKCYLLVSSGELFILDTDRFHIQSVISGSRKITALSQASDLAAPLALVEESARIYYFDIVGGD
jgi:hypothetical protein